MGKTLTDKASIKKQVTELVQPVLEEIGFELVEVKYLSKYGRWVLIIYIDKEGGVSIEDCARVSSEIGDLIDIKGVIEHEYVLEVSSPGLNRPLNKEADFVRAIGKKIKVKMREPIKGRRNFTGYLKEFREGTLYLEAGDEIITLSWPGIDKANLVYEFENQPI